MLLVVDAGNTNVVVAIRDRNGWRGTWRIRTDAQRTSDEYAVWLLTLIQHAGLSKDDVEAAVIGTVVPAALTIGAACAATGSMWNRWSPAHP